MPMPKFDSSTTGRRPKRSESEPSTGEKKNCIPAKSVPKTPIILAVLEAFPFRKPSIRRGRTGAIMPSASISSVTVKKMKAAAARRPFGADRPTGAPSPMGSTTSGSDKMGLGSSSAINLEYMGGGHFPHPTATEYHLNRRGHHHGI